MNEQVTKSLDTVKNWFTGITRREQAIVVSGIIALFVILVQITVIDPVFAFLEQQQVELEETRKEMNALPNVLARYQRLVQRRKNIEELYKAIEMSEGAFAHLEKLIKEKAGIPAASFDIKEGLPIKFGMDYEQLPYTISFKITDYNRLIDFLEEIVNGSKPLVISTLDMQKSRLGDHIRVSMQVNSVRRVS